MLGQNHLLLVHPKWPARAPGIPPGPPPGPKGPKDPKVATLTRPPRRPTLALNGPESQPGCPPVFFAKKKNKINNFYIYSYLKKEIKYLFIYSQLKKNTKILFQARLANAKVWSALESQGMQAPMLSHELFVVFQCNRTRAALQPFRSAPQNIMALP